MSDVSLVDGHIDEPKMTDEEIKKALEYCARSMGAEACKGCPFSEKDICDNEDNAPQKYALNLIKRKDAEIERYKGVIKLLEKDVAEARTDGVKGFAKFLINKRRELNTTDLCDYVPEFLEQKEGE